MATHWFNPPADRTNCTAIAKLALAKAQPERVVGVFFFACNVDASGVWPFELTDVIGNCLERHLPGTSLRVTLKLLRINGVKAVPVVNANRRVVGIVTQTDILDKADWGPSATGSGLGWRLRSITNSDRPLRGMARDVMTSDVRCVLTSTPIARVMQVMAETGHHHVPVVDSQGALAGMVTQSDVVVALFKVNESELALSA